MNLMKSFSLPSPAKINRFLHITGKREDGYHLLQTIFQFLDYGDMLHFEARQDNQIVLLSNMGIACSENLIYRAASLLQQHAQLNRGVNITLEKQLPIGSGLGGGSSNAATTLLALNWLWQLNLPLESLLKLGLSLGADVPFFIYGHTAWGEGIGECLSAITLNESWVFVVIPPCQVSTAKMYASSDLTRNTPRLRIGTLVKDEMDKFIDRQKNDFEPLARQLHPEIDEAIKWLSNYGKVKLSGSGASVFACFSSLEQAKSVAKLMPKSFKGFIAKGTNLSPLLLAAENLGVELMKTHEIAF